jgi:hypothetical protein
VTNLVLNLRVAARHYASARSDAKSLTHPINKPKGIAPKIIREHAETDDSHMDETVKPARKDVRPEDVFPGTPKQMGVLNLAETGKGLERAIDKQIVKDKGHDAVSNLSQYLIKTEGGGGAKPAGL